MFWKKKPTLPITPEDQIWVEESLTFLKDRFGVETVLAMKTVQPTKEFFSRDFDHTTADADYILKRCMHIMQIPEGKVHLEFYSKENRYLDDGSLLSTSADIHGRFRGAAGRYQKKAGKAIIQLEREQLKHTHQLIATISHELAHEKLLGEHHILENDEYLTDLTAIVYGFGIFIANAKFQFNAGLQDGFGWQLRSQGYLPEQVAAYAMASLSLKKKEKNLSYKEHLDKSVNTFFDRSLRYLQSSEIKKKATMFWKPEQKVQVETDHRSASVNTKNFIAIVSGQEELKQEMQRACYAKDVIALESILQRQLSPNFTSIGGSPLAIAVKIESKELIDCLLHCGADINYSEPENVMDVLPLMSACKNENIAMIQYLIKLGAEVNRVGGNGKSVLSFAVETGNIELVNGLIENGADIEIKSGNSILAFDKTPICAAVLNNDMEMVTFLINKGAKTKPIRKLNRQEIHPKMVKFLKSKKYL